MLYYMFQHGGSAMNTVIRKIGNSEGVILPKDLLNRLNLKAGDNLLVVQEGDELRLRRVEDWRKNSNARWRSRAIA